LPTFTRFPPPLWGSGYSAGDAKEIGHDAHVTANTFPNFVTPTLIDFGSQERVGDGGPRCANEIQDPFFEENSHAIRAVIEANSDSEHGLVGDAFNEGYERLLPAFLSEPRGHGITLPRGDVGVPQVRHCDHGTAFAALFLASEHAGYIMGHMLGVDGGFLAAGIMHKQKR
jgi:hypothetical protein